MTRNCVQEGGGEDDERANNRTGKSACCAKDTADTGTSCGDRERSASRGYSERDARFVFGMETGLNMNCLTPF